MSQKLEEPREVPGVALICNLDPGPDGALASWDRGRLWDGAKGWTDEAAVAGCGGPCGWGSFELALQRLQRADVRGEGGEDQ